ncbi:MAG: PadR family transcriptional regulator [Candidatus Dormibacteraeota bacterium]|nr:PadR family transcriptional regulator [Candidatus Dormibacteraeota bacterium]
MRRDRTLDASIAALYATGIDISASDAGVSRDVSGLGRFADSALYVLASLAAGPKHGYAIMQDVQEAAGVRMGPGTLYGAIARLHRRGWIERLPSTDRRHPYQLTPSGRAILIREFADLRAFADDVLQVGLLP